MRWSSFTCTREPEVELKLQAIRIGELGITGIPNEVYGITGLKLKARSPLQPTFNIELANGAEGYIPPPEQHALGGYTTWPARTAGLAVDAEPQIVATLLGLLERVAGKPVVATAVAATSAYPAAVLKSAPLAYWRLGEMDGSESADCVNAYPAQYEKGIAFFLPGPPGEGCCEGAGIAAVTSRVGGWPAASTSWDQTIPSNSGSGTVCRSMRGQSPATSSRAARMLQKALRGTTWALVARTSRN